MVNIWIKATAILAGDLNSGLSYLITTVRINNQPVICLLSSPSLLSCKTNCKTTLVLKPELYSKGLKYQADQTYSKHFDFWINSKLFVDLNSVHLVMLFSAVVWRDFMIFLALLCCCSSYNSFVILLAFYATTSLELFLFLSRKNVYSQRS